MGAHLGSLHTKGTDINQKAYYLSLAVQSSCTSNSRLQERKIAWRPYNFFCETKVSYVLVDKMRNPQCRLRKSQVSDRLDLFPPSLMKGVLRASFSEYQVNVPSVFTFNKVSHQIWIGFIQHISFSFSLKKVSVTGYNGLCL